MDQKIAQYITLKNQIKEMEKVLKNLEWEIKDWITGKVVHDGYVLSKKNRTSYVLKPGVDLAGIRARYPGICKVTQSIDTSKLDMEVIKQEYPEAYVENISVEAKELYKVAEDPKALVDEKVVEYLEVREAKNEEPEIDF